jgi:GTPase SAR1 family protein
MSSPGDILARAEAVRRKVVTLLDGLGEKGQAFELPAPPEALAVCRSKAADTGYQVLVAGEVKRGKSTFVNALIGRDLLPTDVDVATSQVFRVRQAAQEAYRLRFEDDSEQAITAADLGRYGSQVLADSDGVPRLDQVIRWIEVDVPARFLPPGLSILDTPGLGGLYAAHAEITHRWLPQADAVVFVLDSERPVGQEELAFLDTILQATGNLFFIQTKIDLFRAAQWQELRRRNEELLRQRFGDRLADARVWPLSSVLLSKAARTGDADYEIVSRHRELAPALQAFLYRVAGWSRAAQACVVAGHYFDVGRQTLSGRHAALVEESKQKRAQAQQHVQQRQRQFDADWGRSGPKRRQLLAGLQREATLGRQRMRQALQPGSEVEHPLQGRIDALTSLHEAQDLGGRLGDQAAQRAMDAWREVRGRAQARCVQQVAPLLQEADALTALPGAVGAEPAVTGGGLTVRSDWFSGLRAGRNDAMTAVTLTGIPAGILVAAGVLAPPVAAVGVAVAALWGFFRGRSTAVQTQLRGAQQELSHHLADVMRQLRSHFFDVDHAGGSFGVVDEYFEAMERQVTGQVEALAEAKSQEARAEAARLAEEARLDEEQRRQRAEQVRQHLVEWEGLGRTLREVGAELKALDQALTTPPSGNSTGEKEKHP